MYASQIDRDKNQIRGFILTHIINELIFGEVNVMKIKYFISYLDGRSKHTLVNSCMRSLTIFVSCILIFLFPHSVP
jgi:hypothetical protein